MSDLPERVWIDGGIAQNSWQDSPDNCVSPHGPYIHHDHAKALTIGGGEQMTPAYFRPSQVPDCDAGLGGVCSG